MWVVASPRDRVSRRVWQMDVGQAPGHVGSPWSLRPPVPNGDNNREEDTLQGKAGSPDNERSPSQLNPEAVLVDGRGAQLQSSWRSESFKSTRKSQDWQAKQNRLEVISSGTAAEPTSCLPNALRTHRESLGDPGWSSGSTHRQTETHVCETACPLQMSLPHRQRQISGWGEQSLPLASSNESRSLEGLKAAGKGNTMYI